MTENRKFLERMAREADRERLRKLRQAVKAAKAHERTSTRRARALCVHARQVFQTWKRQARAKLKAEVRALREQARTWPREQKVLLAEEVDRRNAEVCQLCVHDVSESKRTGKAALKSAREQLAAEQEQRKRERIWAERGPKLTGAARAHEARQESDSEVRANLSPDELVIWDRVRARIKPNGRMSRTEALHHWMHEHSAEVGEILADHAERDVAELVRQERELRKAMGQSYSRRPPAALRASVAAAVPF